MENIMVCNCKQVSVNDIEKALSTMEKFSDVEKQFEEVQKITYIKEKYYGKHYDL
jgi:bacterioferritin-associated ferredoxin